MEFRFGGVRKQISLTYCSAWILSCPSSIQPVRNIQDCMNFSLLQVPWEAVSAWLFWEYAPCCRQALFFRFSNPFSWSCCRHFASCTTPCLHCVTGVLQLIAWLLSGKVLSVFLLSGFLSLMYVAMRQDSCSSFVLFGYSFSNQAGITHTVNYKQQTEFWISVCTKLKHYPRPS